MNKFTQIFRKAWNILVKGLGYIIIVLVLFCFCFFYMWVPFKVSNHEPTEPVHLAQKVEYLESIKNNQTDKPNVVIILFDDLGYGDLSCYGNQLIKTPAIDSIAKHGVKLTSFYSSSSVCTPSRAGLLTGRLPIRTRAGDHVFMPEGDHIGTRLRKFRGKANELPKDEILLPEVFKAAGYKTGMLGKWHLGDIDGHLPNDFGFDEFYGVRYSNDMLPLHIYRNLEIEEEDKTELMGGGRGYFDADMPVKVKGINQQELTNKYTKEAVKFISDNKNTPFFLYFAHSFPHVPHFASKEHEGKSEGGLYGDVVEDLDRSVQVVMDALEANGLSENTLVIITSDNGADYNGSAGNLRGRKTQSFEGGQRVPLIVKWKNNLPEGLESGEMAMNIDFFPSILSLLEIPLPNDRQIDGKNMMPILEGGKSEHEVVYYTSAWTGEISGVRNQRYKYHTKGLSTAIPMYKRFGMVGYVKPQLNDLLLDNESHNLIKKHPNQAKDLKSKLDEKSAELEANPRGWIDN